MMLENIVPENIVEICVAIDMAILGIAYPIIVDKISNIGDKYSSEYIPVVFNSEFPQRAYTLTGKISFFKWTIFVTLFLFIFLIFQTQPLFGWDNWFVNNSARLLVFVFTALLICLFFVWLSKVTLYNGKSTSLLTHLIKNYNKEKPGSQMHNYHLKAINELAFYAIGKQDEHLQKTLLEFYYEVFASIRRNHDKSTPLVYPVDLYFLVNKLNEISAENESKT